MTTINLQMKNLIKNKNSPGDLSKRRDRDARNLEIFFGKPEPQLSIIFNEVSLLC